MKTIELRDKSLPELQDEVENLVKEQFNYRMQHSIGQLGQSHLLKQVKKDIARLKTVLNEKRKEAYKQ